MDDPTYLQGKLAALEAALDVAIATHPAPDTLTEALCAAMSRYVPERRPHDVSTFAEGWMAVITPLLAERATPSRRGSHAMATSR